MLPRVRFVCLLAACLLFTACAPVPDVPDQPTDGGEVAETDTDPIEQPETTDAFESADCPYDPPADLTIECGYVSVPENRTKADSPEIALMVAIVRAESPTAEPVVYLAGGPGSSGVDEFFQDPDSWRDYGWFGERDVIFVDQRGTGFSEPTLNCPELETVDFENSTSEDPQGDAAIACRDRLIAEGVDLSAYNTAENAADIADLRVALGYDEWNVLGISYGTRLALVLMRDHPEGVRAVILDSVYPPQVDSPAEEAPNLWNALQAMLAGCAADTACNDAYPDLENVLIETVVQLNETPAEYTAFDFETGDEYPATLTGDDLLNGLTQTLYDSASIPLLPRVIYDAHDGDFESYALLAGSMGFSRQADEDVSDSEGMNNSVECRDEYTFSTVAAAEAAADAIPDELMSGLYSTTYNFAACETWGAGASDPIENQAISSMIPTLVLSGEYDPVTPPRWGDLAAASLSTSYSYTVRGGGHAVSAFDDCLVQVVNQFLDNPAAEPDATCIQDIAAPTWIMPDDPLDMFEE